MKIIGKTGDGYIITADKGEVARICGVDSTYSEDWRRVLGDKLLNDLTLPVGTELPVSEWWDRVARIRRAEADLAKLSATLKSMADPIGQAWPTVTIPLADVTGNQPAKMEDAG